MRLAIPAMLALTLAACGAGDPMAHADPRLAPPPPTPRPLPNANGAIFQASAGYTPLTSGTRAVGVGDLVTILLVERTNATKATAQATDKTGSVGITPPTTGPLSFVSPSDLNIGSAGSFKGQGSAAQSNALNGEITVVVVAAHPNGTLDVAGEKRMTLQRGDETIRLTGRIRAADVGADNRVLSSRVADARITYAGSGEVARAGKQGWLSRAFGSVAPF